MEKDIYMEYTNNDFEYISFNKAKNLIFKQLPEVINYNCSDSEKSINFLNILLNKYYSSGNFLKLK